MRMLVPCLLATLSMAAAGQAPDEASLLAGVWEGTENLELLGSCQLEMRGPSRATLQVSLDSEGRLHAQRLDSVSGAGRASSDTGRPAALPPVVRSDETEWTGRLIGNRVEFELPMTGHCQGTQNPNRYTIRLQGPLSLTKNGQRQMRLAGEDSPCPTMGCSFRRTLALKWKSALP